MPDEVENTPESGSVPPTPNPSEPPPPPPPPSSGGDGSGGKSENTVMLILSYLWLLGLIPLLVEKEDQEVQWHAKNGLVLLIAEFIIWVVIWILGFIPVVGLIGCFLMPAAALLFLVVRIVAMVKACQGERWMIPGISQYVEKI